MRSTLTEEQIDFNSLYADIEKCSQKREDVLLSYLQNMFVDLNLRQKEKRDEEINQEIFASFLDLPLIVSKRIFKSFKTPEKISKLLDKEDFVRGMYNLYFSPLETLIKSTFKIFESKNEGEISIYDVMMVLNYLNTSSGLMIKDLENYITEFFENKSVLTKEEYIHISKNNNSNVFIILLMFLYSKKPFSEKSISYFEENCHKNSSDNMSNTSNYPRGEISSLSLSYLIKRLSVNLRIYMRFFNVENSSKEIKRKRGSKKISNCDVNGASDQSENSSSLTSFENFDNLHSTTAKTQDPIFITHAYKITAESKLKKYKLVIIDKNIFIFQHLKSKGEYLFERLLPLSGYHVTPCEEVKLEGTKLFSFALISKLGISKANIFNIFFMKQKIETEFCVDFLKQVMEIRKVDDHYEIVEEIGEGRYGNVYLANDKTTEEKVAIKVIKKSKLRDKEIKVIKSEIDVMKFLKFNCHPNVVRTIDLFEDKHKIYIVMEYLSGGSLGSYIKNTGGLLNESEVKHVASEIGKGLEFLHKNGIMHRDIKTDNIMFTNSDLSKVKLVDFGLAKVMLKMEKTRENYGTLVYSAPEVLRKTPYDNKIDVWSLGVLIYFLVFGKYPFDGDEISTKQIAIKICKEDLLFSSETPINNDLKTFLKNCMQKSTSKRMNITQLLNSEILQFNSLNNMHSPKE